MPDGGWHKKLQTDRNAIHCCASDTFIGITRRRLCRGNRQAVLGTSSAAFKVADTVAQRVLTDHTDKKWAT